MKKSIVLLLFLFLAAQHAFAQQQAESQSSGEKKEEPAIEYEMTTYYVGFLLRGPKWTAESTAETKKIQAEHLKHINNLVKSGKLVLAGPFTDGGTLRGMFVFRVDSMEEARALSEADPAVKAGRLALELHPWYSAKGIRVDPKPAPK